MNSDEMELLARDAEAHGTRPRPQRPSEGEDPGEGWTMSYPYTAAQLPEAIMSGLLPTGPRNSDSTGEFDRWMRLLASGAPVTSSMIGVREFAHTLGGTFGWTR